MIAKVLGSLVAEMLFDLLVVWERFGLLLEEQVFDLLIEMKLVSSFVDHLLRPYTNRSLPPHHRRISHFCLPCFQVLAAVFRVGWFQLEAFLRH